MKIIISQNIVTAYDGKRHTFRAGAHEVDDKLGKQMIKDGFAIAEVKEAAEPKQAVATNKPNAAQK